MILYQREKAVKTCLPPKHSKWLCHPWWHLQSSEITGSESFTSYSTVSLSFKHRCIGHMLMSTRCKSSFQSHLHYMSIEHVNNLYFCFTKHLTSFVWTFFCIIFVFLSSSNCSNSYNRIHANKRRGSNRISWLYPRGEEDPCQEVSFFSLYSLCCVCSICGCIV